MCTARLLQSYRITGYEYIFTCMHYWSHIHDVLKIRGLLQFGNVEIGFYKEEGERKTSNAALEEKNAPIP